MSSTDIWLPEGMWTDIFTGHTYKGGKWHKMTRFMDSIPVLAKQGGFLPLDGAPKGNSVILPDHLRILCFSGNGEYTLYEDEGNRRASTRFRAMAKDPCAQRFLFHSQDPENLLPIRSCVLELRNIGDGAVTVLEDGKEKDCRISHRDGYTRVHLEQVKANTDYEVRVYEQESPLARRNSQLLKNISLLEWDNGEKAALAHTLCKETDNGQCGKILESCAIPPVFKDFLWENFR